MGIIDWMIGKRVGMEEKWRVCGWLKLRLLLLLLLKIELLMVVDMWCRNLNSISMI